MRLGASVAYVLLAGALSACSPASEPVAAPSAAASSSAAAPTPSPTAAASTSSPTPARTPSTSSADVTIEPSDSGIEAVRAVYEALARGAPQRAVELLGPDTSALVNAPAQQRALRDQLTPLLADETAPFDDVIVSQTPAERTHLVVLGDRDSDTLVAAEVVVSGDTTQVELFPPAAADIAFAIAERRRVEVTTPPAAHVELVVDGFHFHPSQSPTGPAVMNLPFPLTPRTHVLGAWYRADDGSSGVRAQLIRVPNE